MTIEYQTLSEDQINRLAHRAFICLLEQKPVEITFNDKRPYSYFPLPIKREKPDSTGSVTQQYRPMAIFEYVNQVLSGEIKRRQAKDRAAAKKSDDEAQ